MQIYQVHNLELNAQQTCICCIFDCSPTLCKSQYSNITWEKRTRSSICVWKASELHYHLLEGTCISSNALSKSRSCTPRKFHRLCIQSTNHGIAHRINISQILISTPKFGELISHKAYLTHSTLCQSHDYPIQFGKAREWVTIIVIDADVKS